jgi:hypothetical protein
MVRQTLAEALGFRPRLQVGTTFEGSRDAEAWR